MKSIESDESNGKRTVKRPNILLITSDQQRWDTLVACGSAVKTPNLDRLSREGVTFNRAYTPNPTCTPARCSILTGHYPSRHGCYCIGTSLPEDYPTIPAMLGSEGYFTALLGKAHFTSCLSPTSFEAPPKIFDSDFFRSWHGPFFGFEHAKLVIGHSVEKHACGMHYGAFLEDRNVDIERYFGNWNYPDYGTWELPEEYHSSTWVADETIETLDMARDGDRPFFIWSSFPDPHNPCFVPEPWASMYDDADLPVYEEQPGEMEGKPDIYQTKLDTNKFAGSEVFGRQNWHPTNTSRSTGMDREKTREVMTKYCGMISLMDHHVGRILDKLEASGMMENTIVVFTSDHGDYMGNHGLWWKGLPAYDDVLRVPMIVRHPDCATRGATSDAMQSLIDLGTTFLDLAGLAPVALQQGIVQTETWLDTSVSARDWALVESRPTDSPFMQKVFYHDRYKLVLYGREDYGELYDMEKDPEQYVNLYDDEAFREVRMKLLRKFISAEMEKDGVRRSRDAVA